MKYGIAKHDGGSRVLRCSGSDPSWLVLLKCPFHDDSHASASANTKMMGHSVATLAR
jgi:hypothetical protein